MRTRPALLILLTTAATTFAADALPTADELQKMYDAKQWPELSAAAARVLALRGDAGGGYDRVDVWMKKAEAQLQANQFGPASQSYAKAADEPNVTPDQKDYAKAMSALAKRTVATGYKTPLRQGTVRTYDVKDPASRPEALAALLSANATELLGRIDNAKLVTEARPLGQLVEQAVDLGALDRTVNKTAEQSNAAQRRIGENFVNAASAWADKVTAQIDQMKQRADEEVEQRVKDNTGQIIVRKVPRGAGPRDLQDSMDMIAQARKWAETETTLKKAMTDAGKTAITPSEAVIQKVFDLAKSVQSTSTRIRPNGSTPAAGNPTPGN